MQPTAIEIIVYCALITLVCFFCNKSEIILEKRLATNPNPDIILTMTIANTTLQLGDNAIKIASALTGKTVRYLNQKHSTITSDGVRTFKINEVEDVFVSKSLAVSASRFKFRTSTTMVRSSFAPSISLESLP